MSFPIHARRVVPNTRRLRSNVRFVRRTPQQEQPLRIGKMVAGPRHRQLHGTWNPKRDRRPPAHRANPVAHRLNLDAAVPVMRIHRANRNRRRPIQIEIQQVIARRCVHHRRRVSVNRDDEIIGANFIRDRRNSKMRHRQRRPTTHQQDEQHTRYPKSHRQPWIPLSSLSAIITDRRPLC